MFFIMLFLHNFKVNGETIIHYVQYSVLRVCFNLFSENTRKCHNPNL